MLKYIYVEPATQIVQCIVDEIDPGFPGFPIEKRYSKEFLSHCVVRTDTEVETKNIVSGMLYDATTDTFSPAPYVPPEPTPEPEPEPGDTGYVVTQSETEAAYKEGVNHVK